MPRPIDLDSLEPKQRTKLILHRARNNRYKQRLKEKVAAGDHAATELVNKARERDREWREGAKKVQHVGTQAPAAPLSRFSATGKLKTTQGNAADDDDDYGDEGDNEGEDETWKTVRRSKEGKSENAGSGNGSKAPPTQVRTSLRQRASQAQPSPYADRLVTAQEESRERVSRSNFGERPPANIESIDDSDEIVVATRAAARTDGLGRGSDAEAKPSAAASPSRNATCRKPRLCSESRTKLADRSGRPL